MGRKKDEEMTDYKLFLLGHCVIHCHTCGHTFTKESVPAVYLGTSIENKQTWDIFHYYPTFNCEKCGALLTTMSVLRMSHEDAMENYEAYKNVNVEQTGRVQ